MLTYTSDKHAYTSMRTKYGEVFISILLKWESLYIYLSNYYLQVPTKPGRDFEVFNDG